MVSRRSVLPGGPDHRPALGLVHRHGLFAEHVLAGLERRDGLVLVQVVGARDPHHVDRIIGEERADVGVAPRHAVARAVALGIRRSRGENGVEPGTARRVHRRAEDHVAPAPRADHAPADRFRRHAPLPCPDPSRAIVPRAAPTSPRPSPPPGAERESKPVPPASPSTLPVPQARTARPRVARPRAQAHDARQRVGKRTE